jgi:energy-converting hydrogenase Eha subunit C
MSVEIIPASGNAMNRSVSVKNIPIVGVAIVEEIAQHLRYGLKWANLSCSFDTVCTILLCLYSVFSLEQRRHLQTAWGRFGDILAHADMKLKASVADAKRNMM